MAGISRRARLSPPLMFAFRGAGRGMSVAARAGDKDRPIAQTDRRLAMKIAVTEQLMRAEVLKDLSMLVNSIALESTVDLDGFPHVRKSILNYGLPDIASRTLEDEAVNFISKEFATALENFEPRLIPGTISVHRDTSIDASELRVRFVVQGDLACNPVNVPVEFIADVELESWKIAIERL
jgi:type VI secretion system protein ImpF